MTAKEILKRAIDYIEKHGHRQDGALGYPQIILGDIAIWGPASLQGAIDIVSSPEPTVAITSVSYPEARKAYLAVARLAGEHPTVMWKWNNDVSTATVLNTARKAMEEL